MPQCQFIKKDGTRCKRTTERKFCWQHQKSARSASRSKKSPVKGEELQKKFCKCLFAVSQKQPKNVSYAICTKSVGRVSNSCKKYEN